jgi:hypothetical protein
MPQQPKFKDCVWNSDKDPYTSFRTWLCVFGGIVANYNVGPQLERFLDLFLVRDPQAATTQPSFLSDPRLSLGEPSGAHAQGSNVTRHPSPLSMGGRSEATGETLGSEVRSTTSHYDDEHESGEGLSPIPEGDEEEPMSPDSNATVSEAQAAEAALADLANQTSAQIKMLKSPGRSGKRSGGQSWLTHSEEHAQQLSLVTDSYSSLGPEARLLDRRLFQTLVTVVKGPSLQLLLAQG